VRQAPRPDRTPIPMLQENACVRDPPRARRASLAARVEAGASAEVRVAVQPRAAGAGTGVATEGAGAAVGVAIVVDVARAQDRATADADTLALDPALVDDATAETGIADLRSVAADLVHPCLTGSVTRETETRHRKAPASESSISRTIPGKKISRMSLGVMDRCLAPTSSTIEPLEGAVDLLLFISRTWKTLKKRESDVPEWRLTGGESVSISLSQSEPIRRPPGFTWEGLYDEAAQFDSCLALTANDD